MTELRQCEFFLLRYVPDLVKDEFINVGIVLREQEAGHTRVRFTNDWSRARCLDPDLDAEMLEALDVELQQLCRQGKAGRDELLGRIGESFSNTLQLSPVKACLTQSAEQEIEKLAELYLKTMPRRPVLRERSPRQRIRVKMQSEFENAGVWAHMRKNIAVSDYTQPGDPTKIDCGYRPNGVVRLFQALSFTAEADSAKALAFSYPQIAAGISRAEAAGTELTAIVESVEPGDLSARFILDTLRGSSIQVATLAEMPAIAERARKELRI
jgi:hypothetical protein